MALKITKEDLTTPVPEMLEALAYYMNERESIRRKRLAGDPYPWTDDKIMGGVRFTNVHREHDRTTQGLMENLYRPNFDKSAAEVLFNCAVCRYTGRLEFLLDWGWSSLDTWDPDTMAEFIKKRKERGEKSFTSAYMISNSNIKLPKEDVVCKRYLAPFRDNAERFAEVAAKTNSWRSLVLEIMKLQGFGGRGFMAKEIVLDYMMTPHLDNAVDRLTWSPIGPGGERGLFRMFGIPIATSKGASSPMLSEEAGMHGLRVLQEALRTRVPPSVVPEWSLTLVQWILCEGDKLFRVKNGEGRSKRSYTPPAVSTSGIFS